MGLFSSLTDPLGIGKKARKAVGIKQDPLDPFGHIKKTEKELGRAAKKAGLDDMLAFEKSNLKYWYDALRKNPGRLLIGVDPFATKITNEVLGKDYEPLLNQMGGPSKGAYVRAQQKGIDTSSSAGAHQIAAAVASWYAGGAGAAAVPAVSQAAAAGLVTAGAGAADEEWDPLSDIDLGGLEAAYQPSGSLHVPNVPGFAEGGDVESAPWPDSTAKEDAAYALQAQLWDMEFEREVIQQGGPQLAGHVDADRARMLAVGNWNLQGMYSPPDSKSIMDIEAYGPIADQLRDRNIEPPGLDTVSAVGASNANPQIWAHEFGHRRDERLSGGGRERNRLIHDAFRSDDAWEWGAAVNRWYAYNKRRFSKDDQINTFTDVEHHLKEAIANNRNALLQVEADARKEEGDMPMRREGMFNAESLYRDQEEQLERRSKSWSLKKYNDLIQDIRER